LDECCRHVVVPADEDGWDNVRVKQCLHLASIKVKVNVSMFKYLFFEYRGLKQAAAK
jgi:hypothetical protein